MPLSSEFHLARRSEILLDESVNYIFSPDRLNSDSVTIPAQIDSAS